MANDKQNIACGLAVKHEQNKVSEISEKELFIMLGLSGIFCWLAYRALVAQISMGFAGVAYKELGWVGLMLFTMAVISCLFRLTSTSTKV